MPQAHRERFSFRKQLIGKPLSCPLQRHTSYPEANLVLSIKESGAKNPHFLMTRSLKKGPYVDEKLLKKISGKKPNDVGVIKTWARHSQIAPEMVGFTFGVHNGRVHVDVLVSEDMVGHRFGEFSPTKKFVRHGGKMQKELETKKKEAEIAAAKAAKTVTA